MTITFRTVALDVPPTPLGLLRGRVVIEHWCNLCRLRVATEDLAPHAGSHGATLAQEVIPAD